MQDLFRFWLCTVANCIQLATVHNFFYFISVTVPLFLITFPL